MSPGLLLCSCSLIQVDLNDPIRFLARLCSKKSVLRLSTNSSQEYPYMVAVLERWRADHPGDFDEEIEAVKQRGGVRKCYVELAGETEVWWRSSWYSWWWNGWSQLTALNGWNAWCSEKMALTETDMRL